MAVLTRYAAGRNTNPKKKEIMEMRGGETFELQQHSLLNSREHELNSWTKSMNYYAHTLTNSNSNLRSASR